jgi:threonine dehydrogenase-like Zn-dependent dehydrogenase
MCEWKTCPTRSFGNQPTPWCGCCVPASAAATCGPTDCGPPPSTATESVTSCLAPARAYIDELLPDVLDGTIEPGRVFDRAIGLNEVPEGYRAMANREALKVLIRP